MMMMNDSIVVDIYGCKCVCIYVFTLGVSYIYIHIHIHIHIHLYLYLPTYQAFLYRSPFLILPLLSVPLARARVYVCPVCVYIWTDRRILLPVLFGPQEKKKETFASAASPPSPCDGSSHIQSQLDKARQGKARQATCLPACKRIKKKIRNPPSDNVTMLSNLPTMDYYRGGWPVCLSRYLSVLSVYLVWSCLVCLSYLQYGPRTYTRTPWSFEGLSLFLLFLTVPRVYTKGLPTWSACLVWSACLHCLGGSIDRYGFLLFFFSV